jgi:hypothetical protein
MPKILGPLIISFLLFIGTILFEPMIFLFPVAPLVFGWFSENRNEALLLGVAPHLLVFIYIYLFLGGYISDGKFVTDIGYWGGLAVTGGIGGYLAASKNLPKLSISIVLVFLWYIVFYSGIN